MTASSNASPTSAFPGSPSIKQKYMLVKHFFQFRWGKPACLRVCCSTSVATNIWTDCKLWSTSVTTSTTLLFPNQLHLEWSLDIMAKMLIEYYSLLNKMSVWRPPTGQNVNWILSLGISSNGWRACLESSQSGGSVTSRRSSRLLCSDGHLFLLHPGFS